jgi:hypothetical protein
MVEIHSCTIHNSCRTSNQAQTHIRNTHKIHSISTPPHSHPHTQYALCLCLTERNQEWSKEAGDALNPSTVPCCCKHPSSCVRKVTQVAFTSCTSTPEVCLSKVHVCDSHFVSKHTHANSEDRLDRNTDHTTHLMHHHRSSFLPLEAVVHRRTESPSGKQRTFS